jgi:UDPglucose 6-dehydrogenase
VVEASQTIFLARELLGKGVEVVLYDPLALDNAMQAVPDAIRAQSLEQCVSTSDAVVIMTSEDEYKSIHPMWLHRGEGRKVVVVDTWRVLPREMFSEIATLVYPGYGQEQSARADAAASAVAAE